MSQVFTLLRKSILTFRRARAAIMITFAVPIVLIYIFGHVFGLNNKESGPTGIPVAVINQSNDPAGQQLVEALQAEKTFSLVTAAKGADGKSHPLTEAEARAAMHANEYRFTLILPADLLSAEHPGLHLRFLTSPRNEMETQLVTGILQKTIFSKAPQLLGRSLQETAKRQVGSDRLAGFDRRLAENIAATFGGDAATIEEQVRNGEFLNHALPATGGAGGDAGDIFSRIVKVDTEQVAGPTQGNGMAARIVGGYAIMFLLFAVSGGAAAMFEEKATGIYQRLLSAPVTPSHIVWARFLFGMLLGVVQIVALLVAGRFLFGLDILHHAPALGLVVLAAAAACSSFGVLITALSPSAEAARGLATFVVIAMSAVGGAWFPVSAMPSFMQMISKLTIVYWSVEGLTDVLWAGYSIPEVISKVAVLFAIAGAVMAFSIWRFNRSRFFE